MAAGGLLYTVTISNLSMTNAAQNIWEVTAGAAVSLLIHSVRITITPTIVSGVAQDVRGTITGQTMTAAGSGGTGVTPKAVNPRNTVAAASTWARFVTTPGTGPAILDSENVSIIVPFERIFTPDQRVPVSGGKFFSYGIPAGLGAAYNVSSEIYFEEI